MTQYSGQFSTTINLIASDINYEIYDITEVEFILRFKFKTVGLYLGGRYKEPYSISEVELIKSFKLENYEDFENLDNLRSYVNDNKIDLFRNYICNLFNVAFDAGYINEGGILKFLLCKKGESRLNGVQLIVNELRTKTKPKNYFNIFEI